MVSGRLSFMRDSARAEPQLLQAALAWAFGAQHAAPLRRKYRGLYCGLRRGVQELQERADALGPGGFVVLCAFDTLVVEVFAELPTFLQEDVAKLFNVGHDARAFLGADVEPDSRAGLDRSGDGEAMDDALVPPD